MFFSVLGRTIFCHCLPSSKLDWMWLLRWLLRSFFFNWLLLLGCEQLFVDYFP